MKKTIQKFLKENYKFIIILFSILLIFTIRFPYYIDAPGGITDMREKIIIDGYESKGSFNLAYVKEYNATIPTLLFALVNPDFKILKKEDVLLDSETSKSYLLRDKILMNESISNAISVAYRYANKDIKVISNKLYVTYVVEGSKTNLKTGDEILSINNKTVASKDEISEIVESLNFNDKLDIKVKNDDKEYSRYAYIMDNEKEKKIGILISNVKEYDTYPNVDIKVSNNESGSSGGLITALAIYDALVKEDITRGLKIVGTGTIDLDGNIGSIGGVEYKLKSAVKQHADLFIVPNDSNYDEAIKIKKEKKYDIDIIGVSTFEEVLDYLINN